MDKTDRGWAKLDGVGNLQWHNLRDCVTAISQQRADGSKPVELARQLLRLNAILDEVRARLCEHMAEAAGAASLLVQMIDPIRELLDELPSREPEQACQLLGAAQECLSRVFACAAYDEARRSLRATKPALEHLLRPLGEQTLAQARAQLQRRHNQACERLLCAVTLRMARRRSAGGSQPN